jgi:hypothetical protein
LNRSGKLGRAGEADHLGNDTSEAMANENDGDNVLYSVRQTHHMKKLSEIMTHITPFALQFLQKLSCGMS